MIKRLLTLAMAMLPLASAFAQNQLTETELKSMYKTKSHARVGIHDPSVYYNPNDGLFYITGTHLGTAVSRNHMEGWEWANISFGTQNSAGTITNVDPNSGAPFKKNMVTSVKRTLNGKTETVPFGPFDAAAWKCVYGESVAGNLWAPDVVWNKDLKKWTYYLSLNGQNFNSVIIMMSSDKPTGPWVYQGPVVYSGFKNNWTPGISWKNTDMEVVLGTLNDLPARYNHDGDWGFQWLNAIDPCVFYDEEGELWMTYGSWFGGIWILKLDNKTGLRDYTYTYETDYDQMGRNTRTDAYFGKKIHGGHWVSGEGSYVQHIGKYYYLFLSYGGLETKGGYEMRIFRSEKPDGPYVDTRGTSAIYNGGANNYGGNANDDRGDKILGSMKDWGLMPIGETAPGHNSAIVDNEGRAFVIYHTRFCHEAENFENRTRQLWTNEAGWLVAAPFEYDGETTTQEDIEAGCAFDKSDIVGEYHVIRHPYRLKCAELEAATPQTIQLTYDGKIKGDYTGSWSMTEGTGYIRLQITGSGTYRGVVVPQTLDGTTLPCIAFTTINMGGVPLWGYKLTDEASLAMNYRHISYPIKDGQTIASHVSLSIPTTDGTTLKWTSSEPDVISEYGLYSPRDTIVPVTLTATLKCGKAVWEKTFNVKAAAAKEPSGDFRSGIVAYYDCNATTMKNAYNEEEKASRLAQTNGTKPTIDTENNRGGKVLTQYFGFPDAKSSSYTRIDNPLYGDETMDGFTVSMWVKRADSNAYDAIWGFINSLTISDNTLPRFFLTGNSYAGFFDGGQHRFDINHGDAVKNNDIAPGEWQLVTVTCNEADGVRIYVNGTRHTTGQKWSSTDGTTSRTFDYKAVLDFVKGSKYFYLGAGSYWGSAPCQIDDILIYNRALNTTDVLGLKTMATRIYDWNPLPPEEDAITNIPSVKGRTQTYDLNGRAVSAPQRGIYIKNGKKILSF